MSEGMAATRFSEETRKRVLATAKMLRYRPNRAAQMMRRRRSNLLGIVHFGAGIEAAHKVNQQLAQEAHTVGFDYLSLDMNWYGGSVERTLGELIQARVEGVLISHIQEHFEEKHVAELQHRDIPVVFVNGERRKNVSLICDNIPGAFSQLTAHLLALGHRRILQILPAVGPGVNSGSLRTFGDRKRGFAAGISAVGQWREISEDGFSMDVFESGEVVGITVSQNPRSYERMEWPVYHFLKRLCASGSLPDAVVCSNDAHAVQAIMAAQELGLSVPQDFAVTGYDNDQMGAFPALGITTAEQDTKNICATAVRSLLERRNDPHLPAVIQTFDSELILRTSCGRETALTL